MHALETAEQYRPYFVEESVPFGLDPDALEALMMVESSGEASISPNGARGIMQTMPNWWDWEPGESQNWRDVRLQVRTGARALSSKLQAAGGDYRDAAARYFGGTLADVALGIDAGDIGGMRTSRYVALFDWAYYNVKLYHGQVGNGAFPPPSPVPSSPSSGSSSSPGGGGGGVAPSPIPVALLLLGGTVLAISLLWARGAEEGMGG